MARSRLEYGCVMEHIKEKTKDFLTRVLTQCHSEGMGAVSTSVGLISWINLFHLISESCLAHIPN